MNTSDGVPIGQAAALFGLTPSTLRWWEKTGVLPNPPRVSGRRRYTEPDLRRIGLAYLCSVTAAMPLHHTAMVTTQGREHRQATVRRHAAHIEDSIRRLRRAHRYLLVLLQCPDDDIVGDCPDLEAELAAHTPRGGNTAIDLVGAARSAKPRPRTDPRSPRRDEISGHRDGSISPADRCAVCCGPLTRQTRGRKRTYCSQACRQRRYRNA